MFPSLKSAVRKAPRFEPPVLPGWIVGRTSLVVEIRVT
jgi:hypothetical protein